MKRNKFGVLHVHDLQKTLQEKGVDFPNACRILEVCNPQRAVQVLTGNMTMNMALPCRISVYQEQGKTKIGMIRPTALLRSSREPPTSRRWRRMWSGRPCE